MNIEERIATLEAVVSVLQARQERQDQEHASLLTRTVEPLNELQTTVELTREHMDARLTEILGANVKIDVQNPVFMVVVMRLVEHVDLCHKLVNQRIDAVQDGVLKMMSALAGKGSN